MYHQSKSAGTVPKLLKEGFWQVSDGVVLGSGGIIAFEVLVRMVAVDIDRPWLIRQRLMASCQAARDQPHGRRPCYKNCHTSKVSLVSLVRLRAELQQSEHKAAARTSCPRDVRGPAVRNLIP